MDDGRKIGLYVKDSMSLQELIQLEEETQGRFSFTLDDSGLFAHVRWTEYARDSRDYRFKDDNGAWELEELQKKKVVIA